MQGHLIINNLILCNYYDYHIRSFESFEDLLAEGVLHAILLCFYLLPLQLLLGQIFFRDRVEGHRRSNLAFSDILHDCLQDVVQKLL